MSRAGGGDVITVKPQNNVYTVLVVVATLVQILAFTVIYLRYQTAFGANIFSS